MNIKEDSFKNFIFSQILVIDKLSLIINKNFSNLNFSGHKMRIVYDFEDFYVKLYCNILKKIRRKNPELKIKGFCLILFTKN
jgi:hypothetical protein